jgi:mRNA interferase MazF
VNRGEIWLYRFGAPDKRRPVLVLSRPSLLRSLNTALVVYISSTIHGSGVEVLLDAEDGLKGVCAANLTNIFTVRQRDLHNYVATVSTKKMLEICRALANATGCEAA